MSSHPVIDNPARHYRERLASFEREQVEPGRIALVGSSHLEWFDTARHLPGFRFVNRGIASDRLGIGPRGLLHRLDVSVFDLKPSYIVLNNSVNDLGELWRTGMPTMEEIRAAFRQVIETIRAGTAGVGMLIINELPTTGRFAGLNPLIDEFNPFIATTAQEQGCEHLDFHSEAVDQHGELRADLTTDGLHLNDVGYALLADALRPFLPG